MSTPSVTKSLSIPVSVPVRAEVTRPQTGLLERIRTAFTRRPPTAEENQINREEEEDIIRMLSRQKIGSDGSMGWVFSNADILYSPQGKTIHDIGRFRIIAQHCGRNDLLEMLDKKYHE